jgi:uncharacterized protein (DUF1330 family)
MSYYFIAQIKIKDNKEYQKYINKAGDIFKKFKGEYLSIDNDPRILEGNWVYTRTVLIRFKSIIIHPQIWSQKRLYSNDD